MKREVIQEFLSLPGIVGIALMDGHSRPYFCGIDQVLNFQQREALARGICQVIETTPENFDAFEFQFSSNHVYIYKLEKGIILLVLTSRSLVYQTYSAIIERLKTTLVEDVSNAIATFRLLAGTVTHGNQIYWSAPTSAANSSNAVATSNLAVPEDNASSNHAKQSTVSTANAKRENSNDTHDPVNIPINTGQATTNLTTTSQGAATAKTAGNSSTVINGKTGLPERPQAAPVKGLSSPTNVTSLQQVQAKKAHAQTAQSATASNPAQPAVKQPAVPQASNAVNPPPPTLKEAVEALNQLSQFAAQYLGNAVVANYWKRTIPQAGWLAGIEIDRTANMSFTDSAEQKLYQVISPQQQADLRTWAALFEKRCALVIKDFKKLAAQQALTEHQKTLLF